MAWTSPRTWVTGELVTASLMNTHVRDNFLQTAVALASAAGQVPYATAANTLAMLAIGAANRVLTSSGTAPQWSAQLPNAALNTTTAGDIPYASSSSVLAALAIGANNTVLRSTGSVPQWTTVFQIGAAGVGIGGAPATNIGAQMLGSLLTGANIYGFYDTATKTLTSGGTEVAGFDSLYTIATTASNFALTNAYGYRSRALAKTGAGVITNAYSFHAGDQTIGSNNYAYYHTGTNPSEYGGQQRGPTGSASTPTWSFAASTGAGLYHDGSNGVIVATNSGARWGVTSAGHLLAQTDNAYDIGASGATRPRSIYWGTALIGPGTAATTGDVRLQKGGGIYARNASNNADVLILRGSSAQDSVAELTAHFSPTANNTYDCGQGALSWRDVYCTRGAFNGSHSSLKRNFEVLTPGLALAVARRVEIGRFQYMPMGEDDQHANRWHVGFKADAKSTDRLLSSDGYHVDGQNSGSVALAAVADEADAREADIAALKAEITQLRAELHARRN